jgi:glycerol-3-phosphate acyltransferase PlsY
VEFARNLWNSSRRFLACIGHLYPPWLKFKGGKGVATSRRSTLALTPIATLIGVALWKSCSG